VLIAMGVVTWAPAQVPPTQKAAPKARVPEGTTTLRDVEYAKVGNKSLKLDLYLPPKADDPLPVIVWVHGGAWLGGSKNDAGPTLRFVGRGYAVASVMYRFSGEAIFPAQIQDCKSAVRWLRANAKTYSLDPDHIGAWGASSGGHLVALLGTAGSVKEFDTGDNLNFSSRVQAVCDWFGPTDFLQMDANALPGAALKHGPANSPESRLIGGAIQENKEKVARANPITYVSKDSAPFLIMHGDRDPLVPIHQSKLLHDALAKAGVEVKMVPIEGNGHGGPGFSSPDMAQLVDAFFDKHLKSAKSPPPPLRQQ
jgi:acetyl esterase/lipase